MNWIMSAPLVSPHPYANLPSSLHMASSQISCSSVTLMILHILSWFHWWLGGQHHLPFLWYLLVDERWVQHLGGHVTCIRHLIQITARWKGPHQARGGWCLLMVSCGCVAMAIVALLFVTLLGQTNDCHCLCFQRSRHFHPGWRLGVDHCGDGAVSIGVLM